jgi:plastocyanin
MLLSHRNNILIAVIISLILITGSYFFISSDYFAAKLGGNAVVITNCSSIEPASIIIKENDIMSFINKDNVAHKISLGDIALTINPGKSEKLKVKFPFGNGSYGYACDDMNLAGQIQVQGAVMPVVVKNTLKDAYDFMPESEKACVKKALGKEFDKAMKDQASVDLEKNKVFDKINACLQELAGKPAGGE